LAVPFLLGLNYVETILIRNNQQLLQHDPRHLDKAIPPFLAIEQRGILPTDLPAEGWQAWLPGISMSLRQNTPLTVRAG